MNLPRLTFILLLGSLLHLHGEERSADALFFEANVLAAGESYAEAIPLYQAALAQKPSANLHYNLGNAYYRLGDHGRARIHWERTLAMEPRHALAGHHLQTLLRELDLPSHAAGIWAGPAGFLTYNQWTWMAVLCFWVALFSALAARWKRSGWLALPAILGTSGFLAAGAFLLLLKPTLNDAIVLDEQAALKVAPTPGSPVAAPLRAAQRVRVGESYGNFFRIETGNGQEGFLQANHLERIR